MHDSLLSTAIMFVLVGLNYLLEIISIPKGSKLYLSEPGPIYVGSALLTIGLLILFYKLYNWQKKRK